MRFKLARTLHGLASSHPKILTSFIARTGLGVVAKILPSKEKPRIDAGGFLIWLRRAVGGRVVAVAVIPMRRLAMLLGAEGTSHFTIAPKT